MSQKAGPGGRLQSTNMADKNAGIMRSERWDYREVQGRSSRVRVVGAKLRAGSQPPTFPRFVHFRICLEKR
jgi:hypothetical protein